MSFINLNIRALFIILTVITIATACNKVEVVEENNIDLNSVNPSNIDTKLAVINIVVDQDEFDYMMSHYNDDIEIIGHLSMFMNNQIIISNEEAEFGIKGSSTAAYPLKSLKVKFENNLDNSFGTIIDVKKHLPTHDFSTIRNFSLRNSGNDYYESFIKDVCYSQMAVDMSLEIELSYDRSVQVFVNSSFYGLLHLRTEKNKTALSKLLGVSKGDLNILKINHIGGGEEEIEYKAGDEAILNELVTAVFAHDTEKIKEMVDVTSFVEYVTYQDFIGNSDWPFNNVQLYSVLDGKFRFFLYDLDFAGTRDKYFVLNDNPLGFLYNMYQGLEKDADIKAQIKQSQKDIVNYGSNDVFRAIVDSKAGEIENEIKYNITKYHVPAYSAAWYLKIENLLEQYELRRKEYKGFYKL